MSISELSIDQNNTPTEAIGETALVGQKLRKLAQGKCNRLPWWPLMAGESEWPRSGAKEKTLDPLAQMWGTVRVETRGTPFSRLFTVSSAWDSADLGQCSWRVLCLGARRVAVIQTYATNERTMTLAVRF